MLRCLDGDIYIFASPIAGLMCILADHGIQIRCLHNDKRNAKEIKNPDGTTKIIHVLAQEGWEII